MMIKKIFKKYGANMKKSVIIFLIVFIIIIVVGTLLYNFRIIPYKQYSNSDFNIETIDKNIDFRRVRNLNIYFKNNNTSLTNDLSKIEEWQGGDIIVFKDHIEIISDKRNGKEIPFLIHHANPMQINYEEYVLELYGQEYIIGHYRIS